MRRRRTHVSVPCTLSPLDKSYHSANLELYPDYMDLLPEKVAYVVVKDY